jgi:hypothetical protein
MAIVIDVVAASVVELPGKSHVPSFRPRRAIALGIGGPVRPAEYTVSNVKTENTAATAGVNSDVAEIVPLAGQVVVKPVPSAAREYSFPSSAATHTACFPPTGGSISTDGALVTAPGPSELPHDSVPLAFTTRS